MVLPSGFADEDELGEDFDAEIDDDWSDDDFDENGLALIKDTPAENGAAEIDLVVEPAPGTAEEPVAEPQEAGAGPS